MPRFIRGIHSFQMDHPNESGDDGMKGNSDAIQRKWRKDRRDFTSPYGLPEQVG